MRHVYECPMRWADMDLLGHVNNVTYVDYLQEARVDLFRHHGPSPTSEGGLAEGVVVVRHEVQYVAPLTFQFQPVSIECWVTEIRAASFTMAYEVFQEDEQGRQVYLRASTVLTPYVFATERPRRITAEEKAALVPYLEAADPVRVASPPDPVREEVGHYPVHVRFSDVDVYGHVNNVKYFEYFMEARILLLARLWRDLPEGAGEPVGVVAQTDVDYKLPILFRPEVYDAWSWISRVGTSSMTIESEICDGDSVLSRAQVVMVFVDPGTGRPAPLSEDHRERLTPRP
ncbi:MAG: acyl-CoA thioesterase [Nocardioides sp.]